MLAVFYGARRFYPGLYASRLNNTNLPIFTSFKKHFDLSHAASGVWIAAMLWAKVLSGLEGFGLIEDLEQQDLVTLFQGGGDPFAIGLLVIAAVILAPIVEELIFRGCLYRFSKAKPLCSQRRSPAASYSQ